MASTVIDVAVRTKGESELDKLNQRMLALERQVAKLQGDLPKAGAAMGGLGRAARGASAGIGTIGTALQAALGPIAAVTGAIGALTSGFQTIAAQDFAEAKVRTLGTNSQELVAALKGVSAELKGQASVAELTAAAYDVASAGFVKASDAALVLKAASLGATGGFSDINTVGNAATSVLNAYGLSAENAGLLVDRFIQTQNDGKIVVEEYARNIGKVASAAAGLSIPLEEVNAAIAQSTAAGVQSEVAFTGLKGALARLASGEAADALKGTGIEIDAASVAADGLLGTLQKLKGLDTGQIFKALGTEAGPALLPVIQNLERFEELIQKQEGSAGAAARAQSEAANTIQGAWKAVQTELSNLFSDQSEFGAVIKATLQGAALAIKAFGQTLSVLLDPLKQTIKAAADLAGAFDKAFDISGKVSEAQARSAELQTDLLSVRDTLVNDLSTAFEPVRAKWDEAMAWIASKWKQVTTAMGDAASALGNWIQGVWDRIASGASGIITPVVNAFRSAFDQARQLVANFYNGLPAWLKGALSAAGSAVTKALSGVAAAANKAITGAGRSGEVKGPEKLAYSSLTGAGTPLAGGGGGAGGGGKSGGKSAAEKAAEEEAKIQKRLRLIGLETAQLEQQSVLRGLIADAEARGDEQLKTRLEGEERILAIGYDLLKSLDGEADARVRSALETKAQAEALAAQQDTAEALEKIENDRQKAYADILNSLQEEYLLAGAMTDEERDRLQIEFQIAKLKADGVIVSEAEAKAIRDGNAAIRERQKAMDKLKDQEQKIVDLVNQAGTTAYGAIERSLDNIINKTESWKDILSDTLSQFGKLLMGAGLNLLGGSDGVGLFSILSGNFTGGKRAGGGPVSAGQPYLVGERGPELMVPSRSGGVLSNEDLRAGMRGSPQGGSRQVNITTGPVMRFKDEDYVPVADLPRIINEAAAKGGKQGEERAMARLQNSPRTRTRLGIR